MNARDFQTGAAMLELVASTAGLTLRDFMTGAYVGKLDAALDITPRDVLTGSAVSKLVGGGGGESSGSPFDAADFLNAAIDPDGWLRSLGGTTDINNDGEPETWLHLAGMTLPIPQSGSLMGQIVIPDTIQYTGIPKWLRIYGAESLFLPDGGNQPNRHSISLPSPGTVAFTLTTSQLTLTVDAETVSYPVTANAKLCILVEEFAVDDAIRIVLMEQAA